MAKVSLDLGPMPDNSDKARKEKEKEEKKREEIVPVVSNVSRRKQSVGRKFADTFFSESINDVKDYVFEDVIMPGIKNTILDVIFDGLSMWITGDPRSRGRGSSGGRRSGSGNGYSQNNQTAYRSYYDDPPKKNYSRKRDSYTLDDILLSSRGEAERVIDRMIDILEEYEVVTVGDFYQLVDTPTVASDFNYGWTNLDNASTKRVNGGYLLDLPRAKALND